jgi:hypothetical protein
MAFALVAHTGSAGVPAPTTPGIDTTGANLIVIGVTGFGAIASPTDSKSNTWTQIQGDIVNGNESCRLFYCLNPTVGASHTFSAANGNEVRGITVTAWSGGKSTSILDTSVGSNTSGSQSSWQFGSLTPANTNSLMISVLDAIATISVDSGYTLVEDQASSGSRHGGQAYLIETAIVAQNPTWTLGGNTQAVGINAVFIADNGITISVPAATMALSTFAPAESTDIPVPAGSLRLTGFAPAIQPTIEVPAGSLSLTGFAPALSGSIPVPAGSLRLTGFAPGIAQVIPVPAGSLTITGYPPKLVFSTGGDRSHAAGWWFAGPAARMLADAGFLLLVKPVLDDRERKRREQRGLDADS